MDGTSDYWTQTYWRDGIQALLACSGNRCGMDVAVEDESPNPAARLEVILQPRDEAGLAQGLARRLLDTTVPLRTIDGGPRQIGHIDLPFRLRPQLLRACHFRITPVITNSDMQR